MSLHKSLKTQGGLVRKRNVLNREERIARLAELGKWLEEKDSVFHLPKTRVASAKVGKKKKKKKKDEES